VTDYNMAAFAKENIWSHKGHKKYAPYNVKSELKPKQEHSYGGEEEEMMMMMMIKRSVYALRA